MLVTEFFIKKVSFLISSSHYWYFFGKKIVVSPENKAVTVPNACYKYLFR